MKKLFIILITCLFILAGCSKQQEKTVDSIDDEVLTAGTLVVGISADYPPFESLDTSNNLIGYDVDMANILAAKIKSESGAAYKTEFVQMDFSAIISALQTGQVDVGIAAFSYDPERQCLFTEPYYLSAQVIVVLKDSGISALKDLNGKTVAAGDGTVGYEAASQIEGVKMTSPGDYLQQFEMLKNNQIDAVVCDEKVAQGFVDTSDKLVILSEKLAEDNLCITVKKGNTFILEALNAAVKEFVSSGESDQLKTKWGL
ncbi:MAG: transporter substrate-binding domain-containing protein [Erysipelotrichaceae bacterium]|nr:transporter substrate-binding domain-containing protein [Erysipelotrichaceae bacterium]MBR2746644.1 transporter substrate-binding domain-containing protein [Erysipelotrichaceae bacterium]MBR2791303.1 transporter substrate-binding domain-containing protein [Erysipelotrichaceae bacterium]